MERKKLLQLARRVMTLPTAPYHEHRVRAFVTDFCRELGLPVRLDRVGNVMAKYVGAPFRARSGPSRAEARSYRVPPLVFVAHMDHPGFEMLGGRRAEFLGGVPKELFVGSPVRVYGQDGTVRAMVARVDGAKWPRRKFVELDAKAPLRKGDVGMWDVPMFRVRQGRLHAAAIDDVLSVVVVLATLAEIVRKKLKTHVWAVFTRAEEVGFPGAIEVALSRVIPRNALVVSMEMSRERPRARIGGGPVVRVGDLMTTFDAHATMFLDEVAKSCARQDSAFRHQRCLMDGGTCEATAFAGFGYRVGGLCLPLGNYHNIGKDGKIRAEYVSVDDLTRLLTLTTAAAAEWKNFGRTAERLRARVLEIRKRAPRKLRNE